jgi:hypothetical protein
MTGLIRQAGRASSSRFAMARSLRHEIGNRGHPNDKPFERSSCLLRSFRRRIPFRCPRSHNSLWPGRSLRQWVYVYEKQRWEYRVITRAMTEGELNTLGAEGWELVGLLTLPATTQLYFKRVRA